VVELMAEQAEDENFGLCEVVDENGKNLQYHDF
jgi:hypothetical protein